ncbi:MAG TPA: tetratricopeptide repeat protein [Pyrinomonadaceae bacterium]
MKLSAPKIAVLAAIAITILVVILFVPINSIRAKSQLNEGVTAFRDRRYDEAENYARKAMELDPNNEDAPRLLSAALHSQFRRNNPLPCYEDTKGDKGDDVKPDGNRKRAIEAIALYKKMIEKKPDDDDLYKAVFGLIDGLAENARQQAAKAAEYKANPSAAVDSKGQPLVCLTDPSKTADKIDWGKEADDWNKEADKWTNGEGGLKKWIIARAENTRVDPGKRAEAYLSLASRNQQCVKDVTDRHQGTVEKDGKQIIQYKKPEGEEDIKKYNDALACNEEGLQQVKQAIDLAETERAWGEMYKLRLQAVWLAEMGGNDERKKQYEDLANQALQKVGELHKQAANTASSSQQAQPPGK